MDARPSKPASRFAIAAVLTGVAAGVGGAALTLILHLVQHFAFGYTEETFLIGVERASGSRRVLSMAVAGLVAGLGWYALRRGRPPVPRIPDAVKDGRVKLPIPQLTIDAVLQVVVVGLGASLGREGAPRQFGAAAGAWISERLGTTAQQRRTLLACGAGAGLAAVYNVPLGGALFTVEILLLTVSLETVTLALVTSAIATGVAWVVLPNRPTYEVIPASVSGTLVVWAILAGPVIGIAALGFNWLTEFAAAHRARGWRMPIATTVLFTAVGVMSIAYPALLGNGKGPAQLAFDGRLPFGTLAALLLLKPLATALCLGSGATGGRLTPAVATGALLGALTGKAWLLLWPGSRLEDFAIVSAAAFLAVTLKAPLTAIVLLLEFTHAGTGILVPMLLAVTAATLTVHIRSWQPVRAP